MIAETVVILTVMFIAVLGPSIVIAVLGYAVIKALSRNPSASSKIFTGMAVMVISAVSISVIALIIIFEFFKA